MKDMSKKYYIVLDDYERRTIINCLNEKRNKLIADGKYTDAVDEVLLKMLDQQHEVGAWFMYQGTADRIQNR